MVLGRRRDEDVCGLGGVECHRMFHMNLPMCYIEPRKLLEILHLAISGKSVEGSKDA